MSQTDAILYVGIDLGTSRSSDLGVQRRPPRGRELRRLAGRHGGAQGAEEAAS